MKQSYDEFASHEDRAAEHGKRNLPFRHGVGRIVGIGRYGKVVQEALLPVQRRDQEVRQVRGEAAPVCRLRLLRSAIIRRSGWQRPMDRAWREWIFFQQCRRETAPVSGGTHRISHRGQPAARLEPPVAVQAHREAAQPEQLLVQPAAEEQVHREWRLQQFRNFRGSGAAVCNRCFLCRYHHECGIESGESIHIFWRR